MSLFKQERIARWLVGVTAVGFVGMFIATAVQRLRFPFDLEWIEGSMAAHVQRVVDGLPLYVPPSADFVPSIYPPLYFWLSAPFAQFMGPGLAPLRLLSLVATLGSLVLIGWLVRRETRSGFCGLLALGMFAASYSASGFWFDLARVDSLYVFLLLAGVALLRIGTRWASVVAGLALALAFLTKQGALIVLVGMAVYTIWWSRKQALYFLLPAAILMIGATSLLNAESGGWYGYYLFEVPRAHRLVPQVLYSFWLKDLFIPLTAASALTAWNLWSLRRRDLASFSFYGWVTGALLLTAYVSRMKEGAYVNAVIPAHAVLAIGFGLGAHTLLEAARAQARRLGELGERYFGLGLASVYLVLLLGFTTRFYRITDQLPTADDRAAVEELKQVSRESGADAWWPSHGFPLQDGVRVVRPHVYAIYDVLTGPDRAVAERLTSELRGRIREQAFAAVMLDEPLDLPNGCGDLGLAEYYERRGPALKAGRVLRMKTGEPVSPREVWVRKGIGATGLAPGSGGP
ncbi:hypothetical protein HZB60_11665 [candidate division KSB1 bacterium]|nr:hypothetical protein [candidate division KSB1 bacterium]